LKLEKGQGKRPPLFYLANANPRWAEKILIKGEEDPLCEALWTIPVEVSILRWTPGGKGGRRGAGVAGTVAHWGGGGGGGTFPQGRSRRDKVGAQATVEEGVQENLLARAGENYRTGKQREREKKKPKKVRLEFTTSTVKV